MPKNVPGASGTRGAQTVARARADGYTIGIYNVPGLQVAETIGRKLGFDLDQVTWIATIAESTYAVAVKANSPVTSLEELCGMGRAVKLSDTGKDSTSSIAATIAFHELDCPIINIAGYNGSNDTMIAVMRGEVDATLKPIASLDKYTDTGDLRIIATLSDERRLPDVPSIAELGYPNLATLQLHRVIGGPPNMPAEAVKMLAAAFKQAGASDAVIEWAQGTKTQLRYRNAEDTKELTKQLTQFFLDYKDLLQ